LSIVPSQKRENQGRQDSNLQPPVLETGGFQLDGAAFGRRATVGATVISGVGRH
jgi:hypothetical protein